MKLEVVRNKSGKFHWRFKAGNNKIVSEEGSQGYENKSDCISGAAKGSPFIGFRSMHTDQMIYSGPDGETLVGRYEFIDEFKDGK